MPKFRVRIKWATEHEGFVNVEGEEIDSETKACEHVQQEIGSFWGSDEMYDEAVGDIIIDPVVDGAERLKPVGWSEKLEEANLIDKGHEEAFRRGMETLSAIHKDFKGVKDWTAEDTIALIKAGLEVAAEGWEPVE